MSFVAVALVSLGGAILSAMVGVVLYIPKGLAVAEAEIASTGSSRSDIGQGEINQKGHHKRHQKTTEVQINCSPKFPNGTNINVTQNG